MAKAHGKGAWLSAYDSGKPTRIRNALESQPNGDGCIHYGQTSVGPIHMPRKAHGMPERRTSTTGRNLPDQKERTKTGSFRPARRLERHIPALAGPALPSLAQATWRHGARRSDTLSCRPDSSNAAHSAPRWKTASPVFHPRDSGSTSRTNRDGPSRPATPMPRTRPPAHCRMPRPASGCATPETAPARANRLAPARHDPAQYRRHGNALVSVLGSDAKRRDRANDATARKY